MSHSIVLFDGVCNLCNGSVQFIIRHDKAGRYRFASLQSDAGRRLQEQYQLDADALDTLILVEQGRAYVRSGAVLRIARGLGGGWQLAWVFIAVPAFIRDIFYRFVARNRYRWFGKKAECMLPTPELKSRFL